MCIYTPLLHNFMYPVHRIRLSLDRYVDLHEVRYYPDPIVLLRNHKCWQSPFGFHVSFIEPLSFTILSISFIKACSCWYDIGYDLFQIGWASTGISNWFFVRVTVQLSMEISAVLGQDLLYVGLLFLLVQTCLLRSHLFCCNAAVCPIQDLCQLELWILKLLLIDWTVHLLDVFVVESS